MSPELAALADEAAGALEPAAVDPSPGAVEPAPQSITTDQMAQLLTGAVQGCANVACRRFNVTDLEPTETLAIAQSLAGVAAAYDVLGQLNPRTSALLTLGITVAAVTAARRPRELPPPQPAMPTVAQPEAIQ